MKDMKRLSVLQQSWWWSRTICDEITIYCDHGPVAAEMDADTARHIVQAHNATIGVTK